jgi:TP901 family phage tail tape measure protein
MAIGGGGERIGEGYVEARLDTTRLDQDAQQMERNLSQRFQNAGQRMQDTGRTLTRRVTAPIVAMGAAIVTVAANFEQSMNRVGAITGATGADFDRLNERAQELGRTTQFSAAQAAEGMSFLAMAGFEVNEIYEAMPGVLNLAAAGQIELAEAADIASNIMSGMNMEVSDLDHIIDVMAATTTSANTDMRQLGDALVYVAPIAASAGVELEEVAAAIGLMGDAGIQGSMAGTSLRGAISRLLSPTAQVADVMERLGIEATNADGSLRPLNEIIEQLEHSGATTGDMMVLFGQRAGPAMAALVAAGSDALREFTGDLEDAGGTAERIAERQMEGLNGSLARMRSAMEGAAIAIGESGLLDNLAGLAEGAAGLFQRLAEVNPELLNTGVMMAGLAASVGPATWAIGGMVRGFGMLLTPAGMAVVAVAAVTYAVTELVSAFNRGRDAGREFEGTLIEFGEQGASDSERNMSRITNSLLGPWGAFRNLRDDAEEFGAMWEIMFGGDEAIDAGNSLGVAIGGLKDEADNAKPALDDLAEAVANGDMTMEEAQVAAMVLGGEIDGLGDEFGELENEVTSATEALSEFEAQQRAITDPVFAARKAMQDYADAQGNVNQLVEDGRQGTEEYNQALIDEFQAAEDAEWAIRQLGAAHDDGVTSYERVKQRADELVESMGLSGEAADLAKDVFMEMMGVLDGMPEVKNIDVNVRDNASGALGTIRGQLDRLPGSVTIPVSTRSNVNTNIPQIHQVMHDGGWVTGPSREVPAILERGEFVLSRAMLDGSAPMPPDVSGVIGTDAVSAPPVDVAGRETVITIPVELDGRAIGTSRVVLDAMSGELRSIERDTAGLGPL